LLLHRGDPRQQDDENQTFLESLGLTQEHVPDLLRMVRDRRPNLSSGDSDEVWVEQSSAHAKLIRQKEFPWLEELPVLPVAALSAPSKKKSSSQKNTRKMASASRKANRKK
jgi:hypothetical protein